MSKLFLPLVLLVSLVGLCSGQEPAGGQPAGGESTKDTISSQVQDISSTLDQNQTVKDVSSQILNPIYQLAEYLAHPWFHWIAFALMVAGVVSFAGQLVLTKFFLLFRMSLNFKEILGDLLGLVVSLIGLVLTTQAATENSTFTTSPVAVVSSAIVGVVAGIFFYAWGQGQEFRAAAGRSGARPAPTANQPPKMR